MKRYSNARSRSVIVAASLVLSAMTGSGPPSRAAEAQTANPPTAGSLPSGPELIASMLGTLQRAGSAHIESTLSVAIPHSAQTVVTHHVDYSWRDSRVSSQGTTRSTSLRPRPMTTTSHSATIIVGRREASRTAGATWNCGSSRETLKALDALFVSFLHVRESGARTLGAETVDGVAVWHVQATAHIPFLSATPIDQPVDLYLAQSDGHAVEQTLATTGTGQPTIYITVTNHYRDYGIGVRKTLPAACNR